MKADPFDRHAGLQGGLGAQHGDSGALNALTVPEGAIPGPRFASSCLKGVYGAKADFVAGAHGKHGLTRRAERFAMQASVRGVGGFA